MFAADMEEAKSKRVSIEDFDADIVEQFVRFIYIDSIDESLEVSARELLKIADKYDVRGLKDLALKQLIENFSVETVCGMFDFSTMIADAEALRTAYSEFICDNRDAVKSNGGWQNLSKDAKAEPFDVVFLTFSTLTF